MRPVPASDACEHAHRLAFGVPAQVIASAPGRVNLIGEHVDYHDGCVLPIAIQRRTLVTAALDRSGRVAANSSTEGHAEFACDAAEPATSPHWSNYVRGVVAELRAFGGAIPGATLRIESDLPPGGGMSSSAALSVATTLALSELAGLTLPLLEVAQLCRRVEHRFAGTPCGIMDPYASCFGRAGHALLLDCRAMRHEHIPLPLGPVRLLAVPSGVRHALSDGTYQQRQAAGFRAAALLAGPGRTLRDASWAALESESAGRLIDSEALRRARHVVSEMRRVREATGALNAGDWPHFGRLLSESHLSLRDDYEVSCDEIDQIVAVLARQPGVLGARMVGGGFGGVVVAAVRSEACEAVIKALEESYYKERGLLERPFELQPSDGAWVRSVVHRE
ncbi:Galactokinase [Phycisphaerae bacterium RAS1]|nr:Galactokinase [Phycisphaerae bacterium RAS1]